MRVFAVLLAFAADLAWNFAGPFWGFTVLALLVLAVALNQAHITTGSKAYRTEERLNTFIPATSNRINNLSGQPSRSGTLTDGTINGNTSDSGVADGSIGGASDSSGVSNGNTVGTSGGASAGTAHTHGPGSFSLGDGHHTHGPGSFTLNDGHHTHGSGSQAVANSSHTHNLPTV